MRKPDSFEPAGQGRKGRLPANSGGDVLSLLFDFLIPPDSIATEIGDLDD
jgi:hypothetical protein